MKSLLAIIVASLLASAFTSQVIAQWTTVQHSGIPGPALYEESIVFAPVNENICWGSTRNGHHVIRTTNGGAAWTSVLSSPNFLSGIAARNANTAWVTLDDGLLCTTNAGANWARQLTAGIMLGVQFFDDSTGVCFGQQDGGYFQIFTTTNGGTLWTRVSRSNIPDPINSSEGPIPANSWVVGNTIWVPTNAGFDPNRGGSLYKSTDRGRTWSAVRDVVSVGGFFCAFKDSLNGLLSGAGAQSAKRTTDGGATWTPTGSIPQGMTTLFMSYIPGTSGSYMITSLPPRGPLPGSAYTRDNGATWTVVDSLPHGKAAFVSPRVGWSSSTPDTIYKWSGSFFEWTAQSSGTANSLLHVRAVSQSVAWAVGLSGTVLRTTNGGDNWTSASGGAFGSDYISGIEPVNKDTAFVPYNPGGGSTTHIYRTTNGGVNWNSVFVQTSGFISYIHKIDAANGLAVGNPNGGKWTILKTSDGGSTWVRIPTEPSALSDETGVTGPGMSVIGTSHIWFTSSAGRVHRSTDGGATWNYSAIPFSAFVPRIHFNDTQYGLVGNFIGSSVVRSTNGGVSWTEITLPNSDNVGGITGSGNDFYVNKGQQIFHSGDRGATYSLSYPGGIGGVLRGNCSIVEGKNIRVWAVTDSGGILRYDTPLTTGTVDVEEKHPEMPGAFKLEQNYPNPFNPSTKIQFRVSSSAFVSLKVFDVLGKEVRTLVNEDLTAGSYETTFDARGLSSGVYFYALEVRGFFQTKKLLLLR